MIVEPTAIEIALFAAGRDEEFLHSDRHIDRDHRRNCYTPTAPRVGRARVRHLARPQVQAEASGRTSLRIKRQLLSED